MVNVRSRLVASSEEVWRRPEPCGGPTIRQTPWQSLSSSCRTLMRQSSNFRERLQLMSGDSRRLRGAVSFCYVQDKQQRFFPSSEGITRPFPSSVLALWNACFQGSL